MHGAILAPCEILAFALNILYSLLKNPDVTVYLWDEIESEATFMNDIVKIFVKSDALTDVKEILVSL